MQLFDLKAAIDEEVSTILAADFTIDVTTTNTVPHSSDGDITYPNLDTKTQKSKMIDTCVLYIDIRRSTDLNLTHRSKTVAKLYSAFVRAMTRVARHFKGHVRGIIGDRVMVLFDRGDAFAQAVECAIGMHSVSKHVIDKHFRAGEFSCGIGIDSGKMLATKTGLRRNGFETYNYKSLVWLGRPANVASKLTDVAAKPAETVDIPSVMVAYPKFGGLGLLENPEKTWIRQTPGEFVADLEMAAHTPHTIAHKNPRFRNFIVQRVSYTLKPRTPAILMTKVVWDGFRAARPDSEAVTKDMFSPIKVVVPGYDGVVLGGDPVFTAFTI